jgi:hypothetical protein
LKSKSIFISINNSDVEKALRKATGLFQQFKEFIANNASAQELKRTTEDLRAILRPIDEDLQDLEETIKVVSQNPSSFNLDKKEVDQRKQFIVTTRKTIQV